MEVIKIPEKDLVQDNKKPYLFFYEPVLEDVGEAFCLNAQMDQVKVCEGTETSPLTIKLPVFFLDESRLKQFDRHWSKFKDSIKFEVNDGTRKGYVGYFRYL